MYRFALAGMSVFIAAVSVVVLMTGVMPRWLALGGFIAALFALLRFLIPLGGILGLVWVLVVSVLMLAGFGGGRARRGFYSGSHGGRRQAVEPRSLSSGRGLLPL
jgi:hypothetical protein